MANCEKSGCPKPRDFRTYNGRTRKEGGGCAAMLLCPEIGLGREKGRELEKEKKKKGNEGRSLKGKRERGLREFFG